MVGDLMNRREEDYIKTVYAYTIEKEKSLVTVQDISSHLDVTIQTANEMIKKLAKQNWVKYTPYKGVCLTKKGTKEAIRIVRAHRVIEVFLTETLKFNWSEVHEDAERLEHATSEKVINALYKFLGKPERDPHGHPIPKIGSDYNITTLKLKSLNKGDIFSIIRIDESDELFEFLDKHNIKINDRFVVVKNDSTNKLIEVKGNKTYLIKESIANNIFVEIINKDMVK